MTQEPKVTRNVTGNFGSSEQYNCPENQLIERPRVQLFDLKVQRERSPNSNYNSRGRDQS